ncbi:MAG TPA: putative 2-aminoethylphosphonate ABC transporter substrate-binding protein [Hyphomicrobiaceae bacterium]|nr:putative 2-aminoethylphosphonate ABC transporter substrate-binding protein [Hyphomicrobiaceae bacterium]
MLKRILALAMSAAAIVAMPMAPASAQKTKLTTYTALENDQLATFKAEIEKAVPEVEIEWVRDSTGVITARILAEKAAPKADIVLGLAASSLLVFKKHGLIESFAPKSADALKPMFKSADGSWTGMDAFLGVICYNTVEGQKAGLTAPKTWKDLLDPKYSGKIVMPHPASSGTGYLMVAAWLQMMGEKAGWEYMDALHKNVGVYTHSGSAPCVQAAKGERIVGIGFDMRGAKEKTSGAPIDIVVPAEGTGWDMEASAIMKGTKKLDAAKKVMDWVASKAANELYSKYYAIVAHPAISNLPPNYPKDGEPRMFKMDLQIMADNRDAILAEWSKRYESKAAPKK